MVIHSVGVIAVGSSRVDAEVGGSEFSHGPAGEFRGHIIHRGLIMQGGLMFTENGCLQRMIQRSLNERLWDGKTIYINIVVTTLSRCK